METFFCRSLYDFSGFSRGQLKCETDLLRRGRLGLGGLGIRNKSLINLIHANYWSVIGLLKIKERENRKEGTHILAKTKQTEKRAA